MEFNLKENPQNHEIKFNIPSLSLEGQMVELKIGHVVKLVFNSNR